MDTPESVTSPEATKTHRPLIGPGLLVTAAFIGPGTVITASRAGAEFGCELLWTVLFATLSAIVLQSLAARLGILHRVGLGECIRERLKGSPWLPVAICLVIAAIGIGNAAYQTGNLAGAATGLASLLGGEVQWWTLGLAVATASILLSGRYKILQGTLIGLVVLLSLAFVTNAAFSLPNFNRIWTGLTRPRVTADSLTITLAMIGTTIVPYNLFLHASATAKSWTTLTSREALRYSRLDTVLAMTLGGFVTAAILLTASTAFFDAGTTLGSTQEIADQLRPTLGDYSRIAFALGLFAAGLTSSITAPLATAFAICGVIGWNADPGERRFQAIALTIVAAGAAFACLYGKSPSETILFAQMANGLILPIIAIFLLFAVWQKTASTDHGLTSQLGWWLATLVIAFVSLLGVWRLITVFLR